jgi:hypothetical protein
MVGSSAVLDFLRLFTQYLRVKVANAADLKADRCKHLE